jgi:hypothetical protein
MRHRLLALVVLALGCAALATPVAAASGGAVVPSGAADADHLGGAVIVCGRVTAYTAPIVGTPGSITVAGVVDGADHVFPIAETATVDALVAPLAAGGEWTCLDMVGDGMGVITSIVVAPTSSCGALSSDGGTLVQSPNVAHPFTTVTLDGDAAALLAADAGILALLNSIVAEPVSDLVCLDFDLAADGTLASVLVDYAGIATCGMVFGTPTQYRDPASQPFPEGPTVTIADLTYDVGLIAAPHLEVLAFHLDAVAEVCFYPIVIDSVVQRVAVRNRGDTTVCGELEVVGGLVYVDGILVSQGLTGINFAEPSPTSLPLACWRAFAGGAGVIADLQVCGDFEAFTDSTFTISGVTFHLETAVVVNDPLELGGPQAIALLGPNPFDPFGATNPARLVDSTMDGCGASPASPEPLPDTRIDRPATGASSAGVAVLVILATGAVLVSSMARQRARRR